MKWKDEKYKQTTGNYKKELNGYIWTEKDSNEKEELNG